MLLSYVSTEPIVVIDEMMWCRQWGNMETWKQIQKYVKTLYYSVLQRTTPTSEQHQNISEHIRRHQNDVRTTQNDIKTYYIVLQCITACYSLLPRTTLYSNVLLTTTENNMLHGTQNDIKIHQNDIKMYAPYHNVLQWRAAWRCTSNSSVGRQWHHIVHRATKYYLVLQSTTRYYIHWHQTDIRTHQIDIKTYYSKLLCTTTCFNVLQRTALYYKIPTRLTTFHLSCCSPWLLARRMYVFDQRSWLHLHFA